MLTLSPLYYFTGAHDKLCQSHTHTCTHTHMHTHMHAHTEFILWSLLVPLYQLATSDKRFQHESVLQDKMLEAKVKFETDLIAM